MKTEILVETRAQRNINNVGESLAFFNKMKYNIQPILQKYFLYCPLHLRYQVHNVDKVQHLGYRTKKAGSRVIFNMLCVALWIGVPLLGCKLTAQSLS